MRQITAAEVKPGMEVQFDLSGWDVKGTVATVDVRPHAVWIYTEKWCEMSLDLDSPVTVLAEPQPEEPQEFGEKVVVAGERALCIAQGLWLTDGLDRCTWDELCAMGPVTVVPDQGWTAPGDTPEVPDRIEEWPEDDDEHLRACRWVDSDECEWRHVGNGEWRFVTSSGDLSYPHTRPWDGPWTRVTDA